MCYELVYPGKMDELRKICDKHGALIVEDAAESLGASYKGRQTGVFGTYNAISFNGISWIISGYFSRSCIYLSSGVYRYRFMYLRYT